MIVIGPGVGDWVGKRVRCHFDDVDSQALGWSKDGEITAGVIYEDWNQVSLVAHIACDAPLTRKFVWAMFDYPFSQLGVSKVIAPVVEGNEESHNLCKRLGFTAEAQIKDAHPSGDITFYTMRREDCRWIKELNYGKR